MRGCSCAYACCQSWEECAVREVEEETGIIIDPVNVSFATVNNNIMTDENKHYITIFMRVDVPPATQAVLKEPEKCEGWWWMKWPDIPLPRFMPLSQVIEDGYQVFK